MWYPAIGFLLGGCLLGGDVVLTKWFDPAVVNVLLIVLLVLLTRGLHQDGLADTLDGLAGGRTPAERLPIMRDPRIGAIGATGLFLSLILRYAGLLALPSALRAPALLCMPALGRWGMVMVAWCTPYARAEGGLAAPFLAHLSWRHVAVSTIILGSALAITFGLHRTAIIMVGSIGLALTMSAAYRLWFGGVTGDVLGATNELLEITFLVSLPLFALLL
jgi:adenosylcobinamide-GDP ribazoletransferase